MEYERMASQIRLVENQVETAAADEKGSLLANVGISYFAIASQCTHAGGLLANGALDITCIRCPAIGPCSICGPVGRWNGQRSVS